MKLITAIIQEDKLDEVREALIAAEIGRITVTRVDGHGQQEAACRQETGNLLRVHERLHPSPRIRMPHNPSAISTTV